MSSNTKRVVVTLEVAEDVDIFNLHEELIGFLPDNEDDLVVYENVEAFLREIQDPVNRVLHQLAEVLGDGMTSSTAESHRLTSHGRSTT